MLAFAARARLPDEAVRWLDAALVMTGDGDLKFPPLFGSGGNEGRLDYTNGFADALTLTIVEPRPTSREWLRGALWAAPSSDLDGPTTGQFQPGAAGGFNQGVGLSSGAATNPWDYVLNFEGSIAWTSSASRVVRAEGASGFSSPFTFRLKAVGYAARSSSAVDGGRTEPKGLWAPLWSQPVGAPELAAFIAESRAQVGKRDGRGLESRSVRNTTEFAEAASSLGVARGVTEFVRFGLLKRRGDSYIALPSGRFLVNERSGADLLRALDPLITELDRFLRGFGDVGPPKKLADIRRALDASIFDALARPSPLALQGVLMTLGGLESFIAQRDRSKKPALRRPLGGLTARWLCEIDDGSLEVRVAAALASIRATDKLGSLRANLTAIDPQKPWAWASGRGQVAWFGASFPRRLASVLGQRMMDADRLGSLRSPFEGGLGLAPEDVASFLAGHADDARIEALLFGLCLVDWRSYVEHAVRDRIRDAWRTPVQLGARPTQPHDP